MRRIQTTFGMKAWIITVAVGLSAWLGTWPVHAAEAPISAANEEEPFEIVALGDSLSAGYLLPPGAGFPEQLGRALAEKGYHVNVMNAGVSGANTSRSVVPQILKVFDMPAATGQAGFGDALYDRNRNIVFYNSTTEFDTAEEIKSFVRSRRAIGSTERRNQRSG